MIFCTETLDLVQEIVTHRSDILIRPINKEPVWVSNRVLIIPIRNLEVLPER